VFYQQGDVIIKKISEIKGKRLNHLILAKGEITGHNHIITEGNAGLYEDNGTLYLRVNSKTATLTHQEHKKIILPKGDYQIDRVREFNHFEEEAKNVRD